MCSMPPKLVDKLTSDGKVQANRRSTAGACSDAVVAPGSVEQAPLHASFLVGMQSVWLRAIRSRVVNADPCEGA